jgi:ribosome-associated protein YbcJ (S4-like RNA binding protein)
MGADLDVTPTTPPGLPRSDKHIVTNSTPSTLLSLTALTPYDPNFDYALWDDEVDSLRLWSQPDDSVAREILREAYIEVDTVTAATPAFDQNLSDADVAALPTSTASSPEYWTAPLVLAFEGNEQGKDGDPSTEEYIYGLANGPEAGQTSRQPRVAIYAETIRDYRATPLANAPANRVSHDEIMTNTTAHEVLHIFGLIHDGNRAQGGIMCGSLYVDGNETNRRRVTLHQLKLIREATEMKIRRIPVNCP